MPTHFLPPGIGRLRRGRRHEGPRRGLPVRRRQAAPELAAEYFKKAGFAVRQVRGHREDPDGRLQRGRRRQGGRGRQGELREDGLQGHRCAWCSTQTMYTRYCNTPPRRSRSARTSAGCKDFADGQTMPRPDVQRQEHPRRRATPTGPSSTCPAINKAMDKAELAPAKEQRARPGARSTSRSPRGAARPVDLGQAAADPVRQRQRRRRRSPTPSGISPGRRSSKQSLAAQRVTRAAPPCGAAAFNQRVSSPQNPLSNVPMLPGMPTASPPIHRTDASSATASESSSSASPARGS